MRVPKPHSQALLLSSFVITTQDAEIERVCFLTWTTSGEGCPTERTYFTLVLSSWKVVVQTSNLWKLLPLISDKKRTQACLYPLPPSLPIYDEIYVTNAQGLGTRLSICHLCSYDKKYTCTRSFPHFAYCMWFKPGQWPKPKNRAGTVYCKSICKNQLNSVVAMATNNEMPMWIH